MDTRPRARSQFYAALFTPPSMLFLSACSCIACISALSCSRNCRICTFFASIARWHCFRSVAASAACAFCTSLTTPFQYASRATAFCSSRWSRAANSAGTNDAAAAVSFSFPIATSRDRRARGPFGAAGAGAAAVAGRRLGFGFGPGDESHRGSDSGDFDFTGDDFGFTGDADRGADARWSTSTSSHDAPTRRTTAGKPAVGFVGSNGVVAGCPLGGADSGSRLGDFRFPGLEGATAGASLPRFDAGSTATDSDAFAASTLRRVASAACRFSFSCALRSFTTSLSARRAFSRSDSHSPASSCTFIWSCLALGALNFFSAVEPILPAPAAPPTAPRSASFTLFSIAFFKRKCCCCNARSDRSCSPSTASSSSWSLRTFASSAMIFSACSWFGRTARIIAATLLGFFAKPASNAAEASTAPAPSSGCRMPYRFELVWSRWSSLVVVGADLPSPTPTHRAFFFFPPPAPGVLPFPPPFPTGSRGAPAAGIALAKSRCAFASFLSRSSIRAACLRSCPSLSLTSSWFSVNHAIFRRSSLVSFACCALISFSLFSNVSGSFRTKRSRGEVQRRQLELKGIAGGD
eukprot:30588-Pelagococcus_subviridis.AAC.2